MKIYAIFFFFVLFLPELPGQNAVSQNVSGPILQFDFTEIIDTISLSDIDSNKICARKNKYTFPFTNVGTDSLIVTNSMRFLYDYYPEAPVKPGGRDSIVIRIPSDNYRFDKTYDINSNSAIFLSVRIKRVKAFDSIPSRWIENRKLALNPGITKFNLDTILPEQFKPAFSKVAVRNFSMDTTNRYLYINSLTPQRISFWPKSDEYLSTTFIAIQKGRTCRYYSNTFELVCKTKVIQYKEAKDPYIGYTKTTRIVEYKNGKPVKRYREKYSNIKVLGP